MEGHLRPAIGVRRALLVLAIGGAPLVAAGNARGQDAPSLRGSASPVVAPASRMPEPIAVPSVKPMALLPDGQAVAAGDLLRTTRVFPNWNLNCEVVVSQRRHICAVETRSLDAKGRDLFAWTIALSTDNVPIMIFKLPARMDQAYGLRMSIGAFVTTFIPKVGDCTVGECRIVVPFDAALRSLAASQDKIAFSLVLDGGTSQILAPLAGLSDALEMARRDPIGLVALQQKTLPQAETRSSSRPRLSASSAGAGATRTAAVPR